MQEFNFTVLDQNKKKHFKIFISPDQLLIRNLVNRVTNFNSSTFKDTIFKSKDTKLILFSVDCTRSNSLKNEKVENITVTGEYWNKEKKTR